MTQDTELTDSLRQAHTERLYTITARYSLVGLLCIVAGATYRCDDSNALRAKTAEAAAAQARADECRRWTP